MQFIRCYDLGVALTQTAHDAIHTYADVKRSGGESDDSFMQTKLFKQKR